MFKKHPGNIRAAYNVADEPTRVIRGSEMVEQGSGQRKLGMKM